MIKQASIDKLIDPASIAVIGATNTPGRAGRIIFEQLLGFRGPVYPVNPFENEVLGKKAYADVAQIPEVVDLAVIAIRAEKSIMVAQQCVDSGISQLIIVAGGFGEAGDEGKQLENRLKNIIKGTGTRLLGPNTLGVFVPHNGVDTIFVDHGDKALAGGGGVAFISQSGSVGIETLGLAGNTGFGLRAFVGLGNKCDLDEIEFLQYFGKDKATTCLAFYIESLAHGRKFLEVAAEVATKKPVVVLKAGRTQAGANAVISHTGRLAGSDRVVSGAFRQYGLQRVFDDEELCDAAKTLANLPPAPGNRVAILTQAGGYGVMGADHVELSRGGIGLQMSRLSKKTRNSIREISFPFASCRNPVDLTADANDRMIGEALNAILKDGDVDMVVCTALFSPSAITERLVETIADQAFESEKPVIVFTQYGPYTESFLRRFHRLGIIGFPSIGRAVRAARFLVERAVVIKSLQEPC